LVEKYLTDTIRRSKEEFNRIVNANLLPDTNMYYNRERSRRKAKQAVDTTKKAAYKKPSAKKQKNNLVAVVAVPAKRRYHE
jgi:hypothetical protein